MIINQLVKTYSPKPHNSYGQQAIINKLVNQIGHNTELPDANRNWTMFNTELVNKIVQHREKALPAVTHMLANTNNEKQITESLYILDRMIEAGVKGVEKTYPVISRFNNTTSPNIQTMLAGIYRKTQVPDAFGPLCVMLIRNSHQPDYPYFNPNEEIGGAILDYLRNKNAADKYSNLCTK